MCRDERLVGTLVTSGPISRRTQAAFAASALAFTTTAPAALAADVDSQQDGTAPVTQTDGTDSSQSPDFDPGGGSDDLPGEAPALPETPAPPTDGNDDAGAIDEQPATDTEDPVVDQGNGSDPQSSAPQAPTPMPDTGQPPTT